MTLVPILAFVALAPNSGPVHRYSAPVALHAETFVLRDEGVTIELMGSDDEIVVVPWYDLRSLPDAWPEDGAAYEAIAALARRAHQRRLRGDAHGAGVLYRRLVEQLPHAEGLQAADMAAGLLEAALADDHPADAVGRWLSLLDAPAPPASPIDAGTLLCPALPPVDLGEDLPPLDKDADERAQILHAYYTIARGHQRSAGTDAELNDLFKRARLLSGQRDAGLRLVHDIVAARVDSDPSARQAARDALARRVRAGAEGWTAAWAHLGVGLSLLDEPDPLDQDRGVLECIAVVVAVDNTPPAVLHLAALAAADHLRATGRGDEADTLLMTALLASDEHKEPE